MLCIEVDAKDSKDAESIAKTLTKTILDNSDVESVYGVDVQELIVHRH